MKRYISHIVTNRRTRVIVIAVGAIIIFSIVFFSFRAQALDTKLEPTVCEGDWEILKLENKTEEVIPTTSIDAVDSGATILEDTDQSIVDDSSVDAVSTNSETVDAEVKEEAVQSDSLIDVLLAAAPLFSFTTKDTGSVICSGFVTSDLPEKALPRSLKIVMTVSSSDGYAPEEKPIVEFSNNLGALLESIDDASEPTVADDIESADIMPESEETTVIEETPVEPASQEETSDVTDDIPATEESASDESSGAEESEAPAEPLSFFVSYAFAQESDGTSVESVEEPSQSSDPSAIVAEEITEEPTETDQQDQQDQESETPAFANAGLELSLDVANSGVDSSDLVESDDTVEYVETGNTLSGTPVMVVEVSFDGGVTWNIAGPITAEMIPQEAADVSVSVPINDPLFWMHVDQLQMRMTRVLSGESSDMEITVERPHFELEYDDAALMPDFFANDIIDIKSIGDLTVFVLEHKETKSRAIWIFQSTGGSQWTQVSGVGGISPFVPIGLKSIYLFWVTADNNSIQGYDTSSQTIFGMTIDRERARLSFGSDGEVVIYENKQLSFSRGTDADVVQSDNDPTLVDLFIKEYVDVAREMEAALSAATTLEPEITEPEAVRENSFVRDLVDNTKESADEIPRVEGEVIIDLQADDSIHAVDIQPTSDSQELSSASEQEPVTITEAF